LGNGNFGINAPTPAERLEVGGSIARVIQSIGTIGTPAEEAAFVSKYTTATPVIAGMYAINSLSSSLDQWLGFKTTISGVTDYRMYIGKTGNVGLLTTSPTNILSFSGNAARTVWMERHTTANTAGNNLTIEAGGCTAAATDKDGGILYLDPGTSGGTGKSSVRIRRRARASSTGTTDNAKLGGIMVPSIFNLTDGSANSIFEIALPAGAMCGGNLGFTITCSDGTEKQVYSGVVSYAAVNKGGVYTVNSPESSATSALTGGSTLTTLWELVSGANKVTMRLTPTSSLTPTIMQLAYTVTNSCGIDITQL
jgi:hypothetical protein